MKLFPAPLPIVLAAACLVAPAAHAATKAEDEGKVPDKILTLGDGPANGQQLSKDQLRDCLAMPPKINAEADKARRATADAESDVAEIERFDKQLASQRAKVNPKDRAEIAAYNAKLEKRQKMADAANAKSAAATERVEAYNALRKSYEGGCENRPYSLRDYAELRPVKNASTEPARVELRTVRPETAPSK